MSAQSDRFERAVVAIRNLIGDALRAVHLHKLSGWWDAGTDIWTLDRAHSQ